MKKRILCLSILLIIKIFLSGSEIHEAINDSNFVVVKSLLKENPNLLEDKDDAGMSPLNLTAYTGQLETLKYLINKGADIFAGDNEGSMALHNAAAGGRFEIVKFLVNEKGVDVNILDNNEVTAVHFAAGRNFQDIVEFLVQKGACVNCPSNIGSIPLHDAMFSDNIEIVKLLIKKGADTNASNNWDIKPIHLAANRGNIEIMKLLMENGANIHDITDSGENPLLWAIVGRRFEAADFLLSRGADINRKISNGRTPIHSAFKMRQESIQYLLDKGADINALDSTRTTPLHHAVWSGDADIIKFMIDKGANVNALDENGRTPLINAMWSDSVMVVKTLLENGAKIDPKACPTNGSCNFMTGSALHLAAKNGNMEFVELLCQDKSIVNLKDDGCERTPLHYAAIKGYRDIAEKMIDKGADINVQDRNKKTPLCYAKKHGNIGIAELLEKKKGKSSKLEKIYSKNILNFKLKDREAIIWYLNHSAWAVKTNKHFLVFDYWEHNRKADRPCLANGWIDARELKKENLVVFSTHGDRDHYDPVIFEWMDVLPKVQYVMAFEPQNVPSYTYVAPHETKFVEDIKIICIDSNDIGGGFLLQVDGITILHPGDHANRERDFSGTFLDEIEFLKSKNLDIDISFMPITGCGFNDLEAVKLGVYRTFEELKPKIFFPMHSGGSEYIYKDFVEQAEKDGYNYLQMKYPQNNGDRFFFKDGKITEIPNRTLSMKW